MIYFIVKFAKI